MVRHVAVLQSMKTFLKIVAVIVLCLLLKSLFFRTIDLKKEHLLPLDLTYVQGSKPADNQPLLLEFWATWCPPCRESVPQLNAIFAQYQSKGLNVVGISTESALTVESFMKQVPMHYTVALDADKRYAQALNVDLIPHAFLINRQGKIVWDGNPMELAEGDINKLLAQ